MISNDTTFTEYEHERNKGTSSISVFGRYNALKITNPIDRIKSS